MEKKPPLCNYVQNVKVMCKRMSPNTFNKDNTKNQHELFSYDRKQYYFLHSFEVHERSNKMRYLQTRRGCNHRIPTFEVPFAILLGLWYVKDFILKFSKPIMSIKIWEKIPKIYLYLH